MTNEEKNAVAVLVAVGNKVDRLLKDGNEKAKLRAALNVLDASTDQLIAQPTARHELIRQRPLVTTNPKEIMPAGNPLQAAANAARERQRSAG